MIVETLKWIGDIEGYLELTDQRLLPGRYEKLLCRSVDELYQAIKTLAVRGAPAIGVAAAYGLSIAMQSVSKGTSGADSLKHLSKSAEYLASSRPTAVNLFWAIERIKGYAEKFAVENAGASVKDIKQVILNEAHRICDEDKEMCKQIGVNGEGFIKEGFSVLTHCNAGALATAGQGTALSVMYEAKGRGRKFKVYVDETRPLLQGARLTAWELVQADIEAILICDNMAGMLMGRGGVDMVITGADRIAANGDAANKIGTYSLSVLTKEHNIPFYIAAPSSTFDLQINEGKDIPIEQRDGDEVKGFAGKKTAPENIKVYNPAFDVTPAENIRAIITERGVIECPNMEKIARHLTD